MTRDIKESFAWLQSILALNVFPSRHRLEGLPENIYDIPLVNVYEANGIQGDDWESYVYQKGQAWLFTTLHHTMSGLRIIRKASGGGTWDEKEKIYEGDSCCVRKYKFKVESKNKQQATNERMRLRKFTMIEYTPKEDTPKYALCRISVVNKKNATSQQGERKEIDHTDSNNGDKHKNSLSHESMQEGGNIQNTAANYNQQILERKLRELRKHHSYADICKVLDQIESEKLPAASPKEHSNEARVRNTRKRGRCTLLMEAGTSIQGQEQVKVEMLESNSYGGATTNLHDDTSRNCIEFGEQSSHHGNRNEKNAEPGSNPINLADFPESCTFEELCSSDDHEMAEQTAVVQEPNQLSHNFNANSTVAMDYQNRIEYPSTSNFATTMGRLDHQMVEPNTHFQEPKLYYNINGNSTEPVLNNNHILSWNRNISAPGPSTSNYAAFVGGSDKQEFEQNVQDPYNFNANLTEPTENGRHLPFCYAPTGPPITDQGTYNAIQEQQFPLCNTPHGQMLELDAYVLEPNNHNINAPGPSTSNWRTTEPENMDLINNMDLSKYADIMDFINNDRDLSDTTDVEN